jgi:predicted hotdog family 3-hydroxylacyl-ACP dehydratase
VPLNREWIGAHIPHQGSMCLLDEVIRFDQVMLTARSLSHRSIDHPLAVAGRLGIACGIEYAAQAMAVHGALNAPDAARPAAGFLAALRQVRFFVSTLDDIEGDIICEVTQLAGDAGSALYEFSLSGASHRLLEGRATVVFDAGSKR